MLCSFSRQLPLLLCLSLPVAYADWNLNPQGTGNSPSSPLPVFATNNGLLEDLTFDLAMTGERAKDISVTAPDPSQRETISNGVGLTSDQIDGMTPEGLNMAEGEGSPPNNDRSSRKMRVRRDQGVCEWNTPQQFRNVPQTPNTKQQNKRRHVVNNLNPAKAATADYSPH